MEPHDEATALVAQARQGDESSRSRLLETLYTDLRRLAGYYMKAERADHTLQPTALVNEACLRLLGPNTLPTSDRAHLLALAARQMRRVLVDYARSDKAAKRGGGAAEVSLDDLTGIGSSRQTTLLALNEALERLADHDARSAQVVELKFFGGLTDIEVATLLGISEPTVRRDWHFARAWLYQSLRTGRTSD